MARYCSAHVVEQGVEQVGHAEAVVHPRLLLGEGGCLAQRHRADEVGSGRAGRVVDHVEPLHRDPGVVGGGGGVVVGPGVVVAGARGEHVDLPAPGGEAVGDLAQHQLGATDHIGSVSGWHQGDATVAHEGSTVVVAVALLGDGARSLTPRVA